MDASTALQVVVSPFLGVLFDNLSSLIQKEVGLIWGVDEELKKLARTLSTIQNVLQDAEEEKQLTNKAVANWLLRLKALAYDADDILDEWATEAMELRLGRHQVRGSIFSCFHFKLLTFRRKIAKRVRELEKKFDEISSEKSRFQLREGVVERRLGRYVNQETSSRLGQQVYGRDEEKDYIVGQLLEGAKGQEVLTICPVVGIGGLGKTTVAQICFNDPRVRDHFEVRIWICVSDDFDVKRLTKEVIVSVSGEACNIEQLDTLQRHLEEKLANKRFLLVLDDVWSENQETWSIFNDSLRCGAIGSSVIVTTQLMTVALITQTCSPCFLGPMSEKDCWCLFRQRAFGMGEEESPNLVKIGKEIVKKCGGVPLAARVLGSLMRFERQENEWLWVKENRIWNLPPSENNTILPALRLSYSHLTPELRQCFAYCSVFPKDNKIMKEDLILLWMANGLIQPEDGRSLEDTGNRIFNELSLRSFFQDEEKDSDGFVITCMMHDLVHDLASSININECCHLDGSKGTMNVPEGIWHLSLSARTDASLIVQVINQSAAELRTFILLKHIGGSEVVTHVKLSCLSSLRALRVRLYGIETLPDSLSKLKHLRYLNCSESLIKLLPESLCELRNLQTLDLHMCYHLIKLPKGTRKMGCLRHLNIKECEELSEMPTELGKLTCLQTLSIFIVGIDDGRRIKELQGLDSLSGEIEIKELQHVETLKEAREANLMRKQKLLSLALVWSDSDFGGGEHSGDVIDGLQPHSNLKRLSVGNYQGQKFPSWLDVSSVPNLVEITIYKCKKCEHLPYSLAKLPLLRRLSISCLTSVKFFFATNDAVLKEYFSLESLELREMPELKDWYSGAGRSSEEVVWFPRLKELVIYNCSKLERLPPSSLSLLETLEVSSCDRIIFGSSLPRVSCLKIMGCNSIQTLPEVGRASLTKFWIYACPNLIDVSPGLRYQTSLIYLIIHGCPKAEISTVEYQHLNSLRDLRIGGGDMTSLPGGLQHVSSSLRVLRVSYCPALISLPDWIGTFTKLDDLRLDSCENIKSLPDGFQHLTNLQFLRISGCHPELHGRCEKNRGEDWSKIAHIPTSEILLKNDMEYAQMIFKLFR